MVEKPPKSGTVVSAKELNAKVNGIRSQRSGHTGAAAAATAPTSPAMIYPLHRQVPADITAWQEMRTLLLCVDTHFPVSQTLKAKTAYSWGFAGLTVDRLNVDI